ncbi:MAG TPA: hypothetical protein VF394_09980 [Candidatus Acidoferrum sp.]
MASTGWSFEGPGGRSAMRKECWATGWAKQVRLTEFGRHVLPVSERLK